MAINFDTLKSSEENLRKMFLKFYNHVLQSQDYLYKKFKVSKKLTPLQYAHIIANEKKANKMEAQILDETSWIISKDMPRAAHLRFLIAIIRSIKDLERMGDFVERVATNLQHQKNVDKDVQRWICLLMKHSYNFSKEIYRNIASGAHQTKNYYINRASSMFYEFSAKYREYFKTIGEKIFRSKKDLNQKVAIFTAIKHIERNADHAFNILENFIYISEPNFYFNKESRKR